MALEGTIKDFGLADIFQLIGIQRKTGVLTLESADETVTVKFLEGQVVGADTKSQNLEDLLGSVLVRTGRITEAQLQEALRIQRNTLQRLGYILVKSGWISQEDLCEALRIQITQIVFRLFRWRDGRYHFDSVDHLEYDREHFTPVSAETILMEGARMIDEWPIIERRIRSSDMVFRRSRAATAVIEAPVVSLVEADIDFGFKDTAEQAEGEREGGLRLTAEERDLLQMLDAKATVQDLVDRSPLGEFDTYRTLYELLNRNLIEEVRGSVVPGMVPAITPSSDLRSRLVLAAVLLLSALSLATLRYNPLTPWRTGGFSQEDDLGPSYVSRGRLERIQRAIQLYYLDRGDLPSRLRELAEEGYIDAHELNDPWARPYLYEVGPGGYRIQGLDAAGEPRPELGLFRSLTSSQRMILEGPASAASRRGASPP